MQLSFFFFDWLIFPKFSPSKVPFPKLYFKNDIFQKKKSPGMGISWYVWFTRDPSTPERHSAVCYGEHSLWVHPKSKSKNTVI